MSPSPGAAQSPTERLVLCLGSLALAATILSGLAHFPGLEGDEAWFGLAAHDTLEHGVQALSGMNWYTGNIYPTIVAGVFALFGEGVLQLRLVGALANALAFFVLAHTLARVFGFTSAWIYLSFTGMSLYAIWQSRVAWEVTALTLPLLALFLASVLPYWSRRDDDGAARPLAADLAVIGICWIGVLSHIIFVLAIAAFAGAALVAVVQHPSRARVELAVLMAFAVILVPAIAVRTLAGVLQPPLPLWAVSLLVTVAPPLLLGLVYVLTRRIAARIAQPLAKAANARLEAVQTWRPARLASVVLLAAMLAPFLWMHSGPFASVVSGLGVAQRMTSAAPGEAAEIAILMVGAALVGLAATAMVLAWRRCSKEDNPLKFVIVSALLGCVLLPAVVPGTSLRYYAVPHALLLIGAAAATAALLPKRSRPLLTALSIAPLGVCAFALAEQARQQPRPPILFKLGPLDESSAHFLSIEPLIARLRARRSCRISSGDFQIDMPVQFMYRVTPWECDPQAVCRVAYCYRGAQTCAPGSGHFAVVCSGDMGTSRSDGR